MPVLGVINSLSHGPTARLHTAQVIFINIPYCLIHVQLVHSCKILDRCDNDPSAGSPTETLLRLHLPLNDKVWTSSLSQLPMKEPGQNPEASPDHSIGRCDGRCVQRAGT